MKTGRDPGSGKSREKRVAGRRTTFSYFDRLQDFSLRTFEREYTSIDIIPPTIFVLDFV